MDIGFSPGEIKTSMGVDGKSSIIVHKVPPSLECEVFTASHPQPPTRNHVCLEGLLHMGNGPPPWPNARSGTPHARSRPPCYTTICNNRNRSLHNVFTGTPLGHATILLVARTVLDWGRPHDTATHPTRPLRACHTITERCLCHASEASPRSP